MHSQDEIDKLVSNAKSSTEIVETLIENSSTFNSKNEYAQEKYLKKKEKKYYEFVQIKKPTIRLLTDIFQRQDPDKIMGLRIDTISQLVSYSGVCSTGNYMVYESGTGGLIPAILMNSIGANTTAQLVHLHPGNEPQKQAVTALNFPPEHLDRCISVNIYSVLRQFYQSTTTVDEIVRKRKLSETTEEEQLETVPKIQKTDIAQESVHADENSTKTARTDKIPKWRTENDRACKIMSEKLDGLVVVAREHPANILKTLLPFVKPSRPIVVFSMNREVLMEMYVDLKSSNEVTGLRLVSNWMRMYQVLPMRTHPDVSMNANSGFLLYGFTVTQ